MRVLHVMASGARGGGAEHVRGLMVALREQGVWCGAVVGGDGPLGGVLRGHGFDARVLDMMGSRLDLGAPRRFAEAVQRVRPDLVHVHGTRAAFFASFARIEPPHVYTAHGLAYRKPGRALRRAVDVAAEGLACRRAARVITVSRADLDDLLARGFVSPGQATHIPNAMDLVRFTPRDRAEARRRLGLSAGGFVVGTVARLVPQKAVADLIEAMARVRDATLVIAGDGPERAELRSLAASRGLAPHFLGDRDDVPDVLAALDLFVLPSRWEGEPVSLLEALAMGLPCVATDTAGSREVLMGNPAGRLVPVGDTRALAETIASLQYDPEARARMSEGARRSVERRTYAENAQRVRDVYVSLGAAG